MLYAIGISVHYEGDPGARAPESFTTLLLGVSSFLDWHDTRHKGDMISPEVSEQDAKDLPYVLWPNRLLLLSKFLLPSFGPAVWQLS